MAMLAGCGWLESAFSAFLECLKRVLRARVIKEAWGLGPCGLSKQRLHRRRQRPETREEFQLVPRGVLAEPL